MNRIISVLFFIGFSAGIFGIMHKIQTNQDLNMKDLEALVEKEVKAIKEFKKKHIDSH
jgi:hypothetical protein